MANCHHGDLNFNLRIRGWLHRFGSAYGNRIHGAEFFQLRNTRQTRVNIGDNSVFNLSLNNIRTRSRSQVVAASPPTVWNRFVQICVNGCQFRASADRNAVRYSRVPLGDGGTSGTAGSSKRCISSRSQSRVTRPLKSWNGGSTGAVPQQTPGARSIYAEFELTLRRTDVP